MTSRIARIILILLQGFAVITAPVLPGYLYEVQSEQFQQANLREVPRKEELDICPVAIFVHRGDKETAIIGMTCQKEIEYYKKKGLDASYLPAKLPEPHRPIPGYTSNGIAIGEYTYLGRKNSQHYFEAWSKVPNQRIFTSWYTANETSTHVLYFSAHSEGDDAWRRFEAREDAWLWSFGVWFVEGLLLFILPPVIRSRARRRYNKW